MCKRVRKPSGALFFFLCSLSCPQYKIVFNCAKIPPNSLPILSWRSVLQLEKMSSPSWLNNDRRGGVRPSTNSNSNNALSPFGGSGLHPPRAVSGSAGARSQINASPQRSGSAMNEEVEYRLRKDYARMTGMNLPKGYDSPHLASNRSGLSSSSQRQLMMDPSDVRMLQKQKELQKRQKMLANARAHEVEVEGEPAHALYGSGATTSKPCPLDE